MQTIYCKSCGEKNLFLSNKPKFCGACSAAFGSVTVPQLKPSIATVRNTRYEEPEEEQLEITDLKSIEIEGFRSPGVTDLNYTFNRRSRRDIARSIGTSLSQQLGTREGQAMEIRPPLDPQQALTELQRESQAAPLNPNTPDD